MSEHDAAYDERLAHLRERAKMVQTRFEKLCEILLSLKIAGVKPPRSERGSFTVVLEWFKPTDGENYFVIHWSEEEGWLYGHRPINKVFTYVQADKNECIAKLKEFLAS